MSAQRPGRPTSLNRKIHRLVVDTMRAGNFLETAAALAGIDASSLRRWVARGERELRRRRSGQQANIDESPFARLALDVGSAAAAAEVDVVGRIMRAGQDDWRAAVWWLEHRNADDWGPKVEDRIVLRQLDAFLDRVQAHVAPAEFERILQIAAGEHDDT